MSIASYVLGAIVLLVIFFTMKAVVIISQSETKVIERLGKYYATLQPGINIIMPFLDHAKEVVAVKGGRYVYTSTIDLREQVYDFARQNVITKDNIQMQINALLYFQIVDPFKAVYEINNLPNAIEKLTQTSLWRVENQRAYTTFWQKVRQFVSVTDYFGYLCRLLCNLPPQRGETPKEK